MEIQKEEKKVYSYTCPKCKYTWQPRKLDPVSCPRCKIRFDR